ncbi:hypothetical protein GGX14DRAFT_639101 [Mycena pura]|uniref:Uncharacterized protein n=1 Tax=Mycena pura TaxID=153505 RepID=A0AAD7E2R9_9AGAR|nr:hypothetical protein GGX14DRAFT_639101 [Mycena pura]
MPDADRLTLIGYIVSLKCWVANIVFLLTYVAPVLHYHTHVALVNVTPSTVLARNVNYNPSAQVDGPSVFLGLLGSCYRAANHAPVECTTRSALNPFYDVHVLPTFGHLLVPIQAVAVVTAVGITALGLFTIFLTAMSTRSYLGMADMLDATWFHHLTTWMGFMGFILAATSWLITRLWLGKAVTDFNLTIEDLGSAAPQLMASIGQASTLFWVVFALYLGPVWYALAHLNRKVSAPPAAATPAPDPSPAFPGGPGPP